MAPLRCGFCKPNDGTACETIDLGGRPPGNEVPATEPGVPALLRRGLEVEEGEVKPSLPSAESAGLRSGAVGRLARRPWRELGLGPPGIESTAGTESANELLPAARLSMRIDAAIARTSTPELRRHDRCCSSIVDCAAVGCDVTRLRRLPMVDGSGPPALGAWSNSTSTVIGAGVFALLMAACATVTTALSIGCASASLMCCTWLCTDTAKRNCRSVRNGHEALPTLAPARAEMSGGGQSTGSSTGAARGSVPIPRAGRGTPCWG